MVPVSVLYAMLPASGILPIQLAGTYWHYKESITVVYLLVGPTSRGERLSRWFEVYEVYLVLVLIHSINSE